MSWIDKIENSIEITTGDGKVYKPNYFITTKSITYNVAVFDFPNIDGSFVDKRSPRGAVYDLDIEFEDENHLELSREFENSTKDRRPWNVYHPLYGNLKVHPSSLVFDPRGLNKTRITGQIFETIDNDYPSTIIDAESKISIDVDLANEILTRTFSDFVVPTASDSILLASNNTAIYNKASSIIKSGDEANEYFKLFNSANAAIGSATSTVLQKGMAINALINYPTSFIDSVKNRINLLVDQMSVLKNKVFSTVNEKHIFELSGASIIVAMVNTSVNPLDDDYSSITEVMSIIDIILSEYEEFIVNLDGLQSTNSGNVGAYIPNYESINALFDLVNYSMSNLMSIAVSSKQERALYLESDSDVINLSHRFYGLDNEDVNIEKLINDNDIGITELLLVKKGRKIIYFV